MATLITFLKNPKPKINAMRTNPPYVLGWGIFFLVSLELALAQHLNQGLAGGIDLFFSSISNALFILIIELIFVGTAHQISGLFEKKGKILIALTISHMSLGFLLLFLPFSLWIWASGGTNIPGILLLLLLIGKIFSDWKLIAETYYRLKKWQSALIVLSLGSIVYLIVPLMLVLSLIPS